MRTTGMLGVVLAALGLTGCLDAGSETKPEKKPQSILKQKTQDIGKYDPAAGRVVSDSDVEVSNPITGPLEAYGPMVEQISKMQVDQLLTLYYTEHGRWPTYDEFMADIIKRNNVMLPVLPGKMEYQYDEENHRLVVVHPLPEAKGDEAKAEEEK